MAKPDRWVLLVTTRLSNLYQEAVDAGMPEEDAIRIFTDVLDETIEVYLREKKNRQPK